MSAIPSASNVTCSLSSSVGASGETGPPSAPRPPWTRRAGTRRAASARGGRASARRCGRQRRSPGRSTRDSTCPPRPGCPRGAARRRWRSRRSPTPSMAAAISTPARLERDSRTSSVCIALPAPSAISSARLSSPASRLRAPDRAGTPRGTPGRRAGARAAARRRQPRSRSPQASRPRLRSRSGRAEHERAPAGRTPAHSDGQAHPHDGLAAPAARSTRLVAQRHPDREAAPPAPTTRRRRPRSGRAPANRRLPPRPLSRRSELLARAPPQARLAQPSTRIW